MLLFCVPTKQEVQKLEITFKLMVFHLIIVLDSCVDLILLQSSEFDWPQSS